jgi:UMF1 family MFS transporter
MQLDSKKAIFGWAMYDWANSAFATTIMASFFPLFFTNFWSPGVDEVTSTARVNLSTSIAFLSVALVAPLLGAIADKGRSKKKFLFFFAFMGATMTSSLYLVARGDWILACLLYIFAIIGFSGGNIFYDSLITGVASEKKVDLVSALGYSLGYLGGGGLFALNAWTVLHPETFGLTDISEAMRFSFLSVGVWWVVFSLPLFVLVREPEYGERKPGAGMLKAGYSQFIQTFREIRHLKTIFLFLLAYWFYIDGVDTIVVIAVKYAKSLKFVADQDLIQALLITQFIGFPSAIFFGYLGGKLGARRSIFIAIVIYLFVCIWGSFMHEKKEFYILAIIIGLVQGGIQALSRSFYARLIPVQKSAEYFGFYNMLGKFGTVLGPALMVGVCSALTALGYSENIALRSGIASLSLLFIAGGILFFFVNEEKGKEETKYLA